MKQLSLQEIYKVLQFYLPWSPMDFIRDISTQGDRELCAGTLTRPLPDNDDLRLTKVIDDKIMVGVFAERLPWDSNFFGYNVAKLWGIYPLDPPEYRFDLDYFPAVSALLDRAKEKGIRYLFATVDPRDLPTLRALGHAGFSLIETRVYYHMDITNYNYERYDVREATPADIQSLGRAAQIMVNPYDRFHADPFIKKEDADRLMYKWVEASIAEGFADVTIVPNAPQPTAFCTVRFHRDKWDVWGKKISQPVFSAVSPEFKGWYRKIISEINFYLRDAVGAEHSFLATQITNKAVIWVWESLGYRFGKGEHIFRIIL